jgi:transcriptional antiterminator
MKITKNRHLAILFYFISINRNATSKELSKFTSSSIRTIKSDITIINELLDEDKICTIDSTKAKGYVLRVLDEDNMESFSSSIKSQYSFYKNESIEKMSRRIYIIQRILSSRNVKIDDIADELYLTRSALRDDLSWVTEFFKSYDLDIVVKPSKGLFYSGEEEKIRSIMVETFCSQYHNLQIILTMSI